MLMMMPMMMKMMGAKDFRTGCMLRLMGDEGKVVAGLQILIIILLLIILIMKHHC